LKPLRGVRLFFYSLSSAGYAITLVSLMAGSLQFFHPPLALLKSGLPGFLPPDLPGAVPLLYFVALGAALAFLVITPAAAFVSDRSRTVVGRRRIFIVAALPFLALSTLLFFLPPVSAPSTVNLIMLCFFAAAAGAGVALCLAPDLALGFEQVVTAGERTVMTGLHTAFFFGGALAALAVLPGFFTSFPAIGPAASFQSSLLILVIIAVACSCAAFFAVRERRPLPALEPGARKKSDAFPSAMASALRTVVSGRPFLRLLGADGLVFFALSLLAVGALPLGRDLMLVDGEFLRVTVIVFLAAGIASLPAIVILAKKFGRERLTLIGAVALAAGLFLLACTGLMPQSAGLRWNKVTAAAQAQDGAIYLGTERGASVYRAGAWSAVTAADGLIDDRINSIVTDARGVWFATAAGASYFDGATWTHYSKASGLIDNRVLGILPRDQGVWFLTPVGVSLLNNAQWLQFIPKPADGREFSGRLTAFALGPRGELWVGTDIGAFRRDEAGWTAYTTKNGLPDDMITALAVEADGSALIGTYRGAARWDGDVWTNLTKADGLPDDAVRAVTYAPDGRAFIATDGGCFIKSAAGKQVLTRADGLAADRVNDILFARDGSLWFATANGVSVFANGLWKTHQYSLPWVWGLVLAILLAFPAALLVSLPRVAVAEAADAHRDAVGGREDALCQASQLLVRAGALMFASAFGVVLFVAGNESVANPLPVRLVLVIAALAALTGAVVYSRLSRTMKY
jgi:Na+/melibiose symporter-like transporter